MMRIVTFLSLILISAFDLVARHKYWERYNTKFNNQIKPNL